MTNEPKKEWEMEPNELDLFSRSCHYIVGQVEETNAETATMKLEGVVHDGRKIGDWEITIKRLPIPTP